MKKRILSISLSLLLLAAMIPSAAAAETATAPAIDVAEMPATRGMTILELYRLAGEPAPEKQSPFSDVKPESEYARAISWAWEKGIAKGVSDTLFDLNAPCGTESCAVFFYRYARFAGLDIAIPEGTKAPEGTHPWAAEAMAWAEGKGLTVNTITKMAESLGIKKEPSQAASAPAEENSNTAPATTDGKKRSHKFGKNVGDYLPGNPVTNPTYGKTYLIQEVSTGKFLTCDELGIDQAPSYQTVANASKWLFQDAGENKFLIRDLRAWKVLRMVNGSAILREPEGSPEEIFTFEETADGLVLKNNNGTLLAYLDYDHWNLYEVNAGTALDFSSNGEQTLGIRTFNITNGNVDETSGYYNIAPVELPSGGYTLSYRDNDNYSIGLKVIRVNNALVDLGYLSPYFHNDCEYKGETANAVSRFQGDIGIYVTGEVDLQTWQALGYDANSWENLGAYIADFKVPAYGSSRAAYIAAMLDTAAEYAQAGTAYAKGAAGDPGSFISDAGLVLQCLYSAGISPGLSIIDHARLEYENLAAGLANDTQLGEEVTSAEPGDLIFYGNAVVNHVAVYAGNGMIYDSWPGMGVTKRNMYSAGNILKIVRVF